MIPFDITPLELLGLPACASEPEIRAAYRALAMAIHPDLVPGNPLGATSLFKILNLALDASAKNVWSAKGAPSRKPVMDPRFFGWTLSQKGNWTLLSHDHTRYTVYLKDGVWRWLRSQEGVAIPDFSSTAFFTYQESIEDVMNEYELGRK